MKTVFILGAGASHEFGYPLGSELNGQILQQLGMGTKVRSNFAERLGHSETTLFAVEEFRRGLHRSEYDTIDQYLGAQHRNPHLHRAKFRHGKARLAQEVPDRHHTRPRLRQFHWNSISCDASRGSQGRPIRVNKLNPGNF